jgi:conjugative transposon TraJ protein
MCVRAVVMIAVSCVPVLLFAQDDGGVADDIHSMQSVLDGIYDEMIPLCTGLIDVGRGIAGFAALWYIASRVWRSLANAEPIDFYPLLRPFAICIAIGFFFNVIGLIRGVMEPTVDGTNAMLEDSQKAVAVLLEKKEEAVKQTEFWQMYVGETGSGDYDKWYKYTYPGEDASDEGWMDGIGNDIKFALAKASYNFRNSVKQWMADVLDILYEAAALCINTIRTFILVILSILGPLVFGLSVFDGFQHTLTTWLARYINIFLWLPVANILGTVLSKIQENMLQIDIDQVQATGDTFFSATDAGYLIFMVIGIVSYFTVPSVANWIVQAGGHNALLVKTTNMSSTVASGTVSMTGAAGSQFMRDLGNDMGKVGGK